MNILLIAPYFPSEGGGLEQYALSIARHLSPKHRFAVLCLSREKNQQEQSEDIRIIRKKADFILSHTPIRFSFLFDILRMLREENFDIIWAHTPVPFAADMAALASRIKKVPLVITYHTGKLVKGKFFLDAVVKMYEIFERFTLNTAKKIVFVSPHILEEKRMRKYKEGRKSEMVFPGADPKDFPYKPLPQEPVVLFVSPLKSMYRWKGFEIFLDAARLVIKNIPEAKFFIAGEKGDAFFALQKRVQDLGLESSVEFLGKIPHEKMHELYAKSMIVAVPSLDATEGTPTVLFEAAATGRPVVGSRVGGIPWVVKDGETGILTEPGNAESLAHRLTELLKDTAKTATMGECARERIQERFTWSHASEKYESIFQEVRRS